MDDKTLNSLWKLQSLSVRASVRASAHEHALPPLPAPLPSHWPAHADKNETATSIKHQARAKRALNSNFSCFPLLGHLEI